MGSRLGKLATDLGERSTYDAASQCSRCGYCEQACPTYVATGSESKSGRGRNQLVRMMLEGKLEDPSAAEEALSTCLLCGACTTACYAHVPTADIVLEGRRMLREKPHWLASLLTGLLVLNPRSLRAILKGAYRWKRLGFSRLARPFLRLLGLKGLAVADGHVEEVPARFLEEELAGVTAEKPAWYYFAACGTNFLFPRVGLATVEVLRSLKGEGSFMQNGCCGLLAYNYGDLQDAKILAKRNFERLQALEVAAGADAPAASVVVDCSSCAAFMKSYPQLFLDDVEWKDRAQKFSARVKDAVEVLEKEDVPAAEVGRLVVYHESCRACHGQGLKPPRALLERLCGGSFRELPEADVCCGGAGAFAFVHPELSDEVLRRKVGSIAGTQAGLVITSSTSCLIQLAHGLKKYYPEARVMHLSELAAIALRTGASDGTTPRA